MKNLLTLIAVMMMMTCKASAQIEGEVMDNQNKPVLNVVITATDSTTGKIVATVKPDKRGFYAIDSLAPGKYKIEAKAAGFAPFSKTVSVDKAPKGSDPIDDTYYAVLVDIILKPAKEP